MFPLGSSELEKARDETLLVQVRRVFCAFRFRLFFSLERPGRRADVTAPGGAPFPFFFLFFFCLSSSTFDRLADSLPSTATGNRWGTETFHPILVAPTVLFVCSVSFFGELDRQSIADPMP